MADVYSYDKTEDGSQHYPPFRWRRRRSRIYAAGPPFSLIKSVLFTCLIHYTEYRSHALFRAVDRANFPSDPAPNVECVKRLKVLHWKMLGMTSRIVKQFKLASGRRKSVMPQSALVCGNLSLVNHESFCCSVFHIWRFLPSSGQSAERHNCKKVKLACGTVPLVNDEVFSYYFVLLPSQSHVMPPPLFRLVC